MLPSKSIHAYIFIAILLIGGLSVPKEGCASYTFKSKKFDSYTAYKSYVIEYMKAWRIAHGKTENSNTTKDVSRSELGIRTDLATDIAYNSARLTGSIDFNDSDKVRIWFDYGVNKYILSQRTETEVITEGKYNSKFDRKLLHLVGDTTYFYRAGGINEDAVVEYGNIRSFTTKVNTADTNALIKVTTSNARDIEENRATLRASMSFKKQSFADLWFEYGEDENDLYKKTPKILVQKSNGRYFTKIISRLDSEQEYYYRAVAEDEFGEITYGKIKSFKTKTDIPNELPEVTTYRADNISTHTATLHGFVDMNDYRNAEVFFIYGEDKKDVAEVEKEYTSFERIRERGDNRQKILLDEDHDKFNTFTKTVSYLDLDTKHYFAIGVSFENEEEDEMIILGRTYSFTTKK